MRTSITHRKFTHLLISLFLLSVLLISSGCVKAQIAIDVHQNGAAEVAVAMGMTAQAKALIGSQGESPSRLMSDALSGSEPFVSTRQWVDGDYEWMEGKISLPSLDELNNRLNSNPNIIRSFRLIKESGFFKDRFILDAVLEPLSKSTGETGGEASPEFSFDPAGMIDFRVLVRLPGEIVETNGVYDQDASALTWVFASDAPVTLHAESEAWNWVNIGIIGGGGALVILLFIAGGVFLAAGLARGERKSAPQPVQTPGSPRLISPAMVEPVPPAALPDVPVWLTEASKPDLLVQLQVREMLEQINLHILKNTGVIIESPDELRLAWPDADGPDGQREIVICAAGEAEIAVNDVLCPADRNMIQASLVKQLKRMNAM